jgi:hypothetical protein
MNNQEIKKYRIDNIIFLKGFHKTDGPNLCSAKCCSGGVYIDLTEKEKILSFKEQIIQEMDETQNLDISSWFDDEIIEDTDFYSGKCICTKTFHDKCVFLNKEKLCVLQVVSTKFGYHKWFLKPFFCILFPLTIEENTITFDDYQNGNEKCCSILNDFCISLYEACQEEIGFLFGEESHKYIRDCYFENKFDLPNSSLESKYLKN